MEKVNDIEGNPIGYSYRCSWCHDCSPVFSTEDEAITAYLAHQETEACKLVEARYDYYMNAL